ncbi:MAG: dihydrofolate reductase [Spirosomataceae bacterium]
MNISIIVAVAKNGAIGKDNQLLWRLSDDLKQFRKLTTGHTIIMGRKTFDSIGKALPNRINIIISRQENLQIEGCHVVNSIEKAIELAKKLEQNGEIFIIGGGNVYRQALGLTNKIYLTEVHAEIDGDTHFEFNHSEWKEVNRISFEKNDKNEYDFDIIELTR